DSPRPGMRRIQIDSHVGNGIGEILRRDDQPRVANGRENGGFVFRASGQKPYPERHPKPEQISDYELHRRLDYTKAGPAESMQRYLARISLLPFRSVYIEGNSRPFGNEGRGVIVL